jgi:hypothetical protein
MSLALFATVAVLRPHISAADISKFIGEAMAYAAKSELNVCTA